MERLQATVNPPDNVSMQKHSYAASHPNQSRDSKCTADLVKAWSSKSPDSHTPVAYSKFRLCCCCCCQGYAIEVCTLVIRSRLPGRHRVEAWLLCWFLLSPSRVASSHSSASLLGRDNEWWEKSVWCACVHCVAQLSLSLFVCVCECVCIHTP